MRGEGTYEYELENGEPDSLALDLDSAYTLNVEDDSTVDDEFDLLDGNN